MINHSKELEIPENKPFENCQLDREQYAEILTDVVSVYDETGCVMALNGEWGVGKTTFVKMWKQFLENKDYHTLYYNAWESDFVTDPLIAMISEIQELIKNRKSDFAEKFIRLIASLVKGGGKYLLKKYTGYEDIFDSSLDELENICKESMKDYYEQKKVIAEFKDCLTEYVADNSDGKPIVFFIDELDRCSPEFAVRTLEQIKHLFDIPNVVFVLSINKKQLECAIQGYFGSSKMDAEEYLRRFIDIDYNLPYPDVKKYLSYLLNLYKFSLFFNKKERKMNSYLRYNEEQFTNFIYLIVTYNQINLRLMDRIVAYTRIVLMGFNSSTNIMPEVLVLLIFLRISYSDFYNSINYRLCDIQTILSYIEKILPESMLKKMSDDNLKVVSHTNHALATLILSYIKDNPIYNPNHLIQSIRNKDVNFQTKIINPELLADALSEKYKTAEFIDLDVLLKRVNLTMNLKNKN